MDDVLVPVGAFAMVVAIVWITSSNRMKSARTHTEAVGKLIDKLGTSQEAMTYLESESGRRLIEALSVKPPTPYNRILGAAGTGVVLTALGIGLLVLGMSPVGEEEAIGGGIVVSSLGIGFLMAAMLSHRLSMAWGLIKAQGAALHE